jgi:polyribonucleotide nucleotidyltransferase
MEKKYNLSEFGIEAVIGKFAGQADGAVWLQQGGTVVLATVVTEQAKDFPGYFPLMVDYREQLASVGRIPGGYMKREGKPSDEEVLVGRLIDRAIRPLFPVNYFDKVQVSVTVYSVDKEHMPHPLALLATSLALTISPIPFMGPVGICDVARIGGELVFNPTYAQSHESDIELIVVGNDSGINMVEGSAQELLEKDFVDALFKAHEFVKRQIVWQQEVQRDQATVNQAVVDAFGWETWVERARQVVTRERVEALFIADKIERSKKQKELEALFQETYAAEIKESATSLAFLGIVFEQVTKDFVTELVFERNSRIDGRKFDQVRTISTEVGLLPCNHGSALFTRGHTQALVSVTLGGGQDQMRVEGLLGEKSKTFMLHYNFPSFSVGEVRPSRGPGRREIGHGHLAASAIERVLPTQENFPYTIRIVADILESDGSSSMATVCGTNMALMNAGVPITKMVSGVAMGLLMHDNGDFRVLTDMSGVEDALGMMDFKVVGTEQGIVAIQMDIKYKSGLPRAIFERALEQARLGRLHILKEMQKVMSAPAEKLSELVPQIVSFKIPRDKIGAVIGSGGKVIREIISETETSIDIEDDGLVKIFGHPGPLLDRAVSLVKVLSGQLDIGTRYAGKVKRLADFGLFVELAPGQDGLVHISTVPRSQQDAFMQKHKEGDALQVEVLDYDKASGRIRLKIVE